MFLPQKDRWQVGRSFGWSNFYRRLSKGYGKTAAAAAFISLAFCSMMLAKIT
jgi:transposase